MRNQPTYDLERLLFRRQFILGPHFIEKLASWKRLTVGDRFFLTVHSDLYTYQAANGEKSITLLGYVLDPNNPQASDADIVKALLRKLIDHANLDEFFTETYSFGGRWVLIVDNGREIRLFNDATGLRQVFYSVLPSGMWCASQPGILAEELNLKPDEEALQFLRSCQCRSEKQYWLPGDTSPYREIKHLLPNHYLDMETGDCFRYWPRENLSRASLRKTVEASSRLLKGLMHSASHRFDLALSLTAGWDSRVLLACSKEIKDSLFYFTKIFWEPFVLTEDSPDVAVPARLLHKLGLEHHVIECPSSMEEEFSEIYKRNVTWAHDSYGAMAQGLYDHYPQDRVCVKGNAGEVAKCYYAKSILEGEEITAGTLARLTDMEPSSFVLNAFEGWLLDLQNPYNISLLDLFYWEQRMGNWQAMAQSEWDIVQEVVTPLNCRTLLATMLSTDKEYRMPPTYELHKEIITDLWPEVLSEPVNPHVESETRMKAFARRILVDTHVYGLLPQGIRKLGKYL